MYLPIHRKIVQGGNLVKQTIQTFKTTLQKHPLLYLWLTVFTCEMTMRLFIWGTIWTNSVLFASLFDTVAVCIAGFLTLKIRNDARRKRLFFFTILVFCTIFMSQLIFYKMMTTFYTFYSLENAGKTLEFAGMAFLGFLKNLLPALVMYIPLVGALHIYKKGVQIEPLDQRKWLLLPIVAVGVHLSTIGILHLWERSENSPYSVYYQINCPEFSVSNLGLLSYMRIDAQRYLFGWKMKIDDIEEAAQNPTDVLELEEESKDNSTASAAGANGQSHSNSGVSGTVTETNSQTVKDQVLPIDFDALIREEEDDILLSMHQYFKEVEPSKTNAYTGIYKDYNLIFITAEAFSHLAIDPELTPTLYKMAHEGYYFPNFYTPLWGVSTSDGEYVANTGLIPKNGVWSFSQSSENNMAFALGNQLRKEGYQTNAYHNHTYTYYNRHLSHPNMGYDYKGVGNGLVVEDIWPESDSEMMKVSIPDYINAEHFHAYYMTVSGHMHYEVDSNSMTAKHFDLVKDLPYSENVKGYLAAQIELDRAVAYLLEELEKAGVADKTLIAIGADHYPYGLKLEEMEELAGQPIDPNFELYHNAFILYTPNMEPQTVEKYGSSLDIMPTLSNLLGLPYDSRLLMGRDLFSDSPALVVFSNYSYITDVGKWNTAEKVFEPFVDLPEEQLETYREKMTEYVKSMFYFSAKILDENYYDIITKQLNK